MIKIKYKIVVDKDGHGFDIKIRYPSWYEYDTEEGQEESNVIDVLKNMLDDLFWTFANRSYVKLTLDEE